MLVFYINFDAFKPSDQELSDSVQTWDSTGAVIHCQDIVCVASSNACIDILHPMEKMPKYIYSVSFYRNCCAVCFTTAFKWCISSAA